MTDYAGFRSSNSGWSPRPAAITAFLVVITVPAMALQGLFVLAAPPLARRFPPLWHSLVCRLFGIKVVIIGSPVLDRACLYASNHLSWLDIVVFGSQLPASFIAKQEVAGWGVFGWLAKLQRTVFIDRNRRSKTAAQRDELVRRFSRGEQLILFPEGTSTDGTWVMPFKSALFSVAEKAEDPEALAIQPVTISYTHFNGVPSVRSQRPRIAWFGDMELTSHILEVLSIGRIVAVLQFHAPLDAQALGSRKAMADASYKAVASGLEAANRGRLPIPGAQSD